MVRRLTAVLLGVMAICVAWGALGVLGQFGNGVAWAQRPIAKPPANQGREQPGDPSKDDQDSAMGIGDQVRLPRDRNAERKLEEARRLIEQKQWRQAIDLLQSMLDEKEDKFMQDTRGRWVSVRTEANRLIASMGAEGLQHYEQYYGGKARNALQEGLKSGDLQKIGEVALRYLHTEAGGDALAALGTVQLDQGSPVMAGLYFQRLLSRYSDWSQLPTRTLLKAAFALERSGATALSEALWRELQRRDWQRDLPEPLARLNWSQLRRLAAASGIAHVQRQRSDWLMFGGDAQRTAISEGTAPFLEKVQEVRTYRELVTRTEIENAVRSLQQARRPILPAGLPIGVGETVFCRTAFGIQAVHIRTGEVKWTSSYEDNLETILLTRRSPDYMQELELYRRTAPFFLVHNTLLGTLSADHERVYTVEDTPIPPIVSRRQPNVFPPGRFPVAMGAWSQGNNLSAFELRGGRCVWMLEGNKNNPGSLVSETFFLGPPLPLGGKLYVLGESNGEIRLICLEPQTGAVQWIQPLCYVESRIQEEPHRRVNACHLAYADGILVCPTNAGVVLAVDLLTRSLVWARPYKRTEAYDNNLKRPIPVGPPSIWGDRQWFYAAPMIAEGKVVFTAPDGDAIYCVHLRDGSLAWNPLPRQSDDLYVAGIYQSRIIVVGRESVRALQLADGKLIWRTGLPNAKEGPSGRGVANATTYFLPMHNGTVLALSLQDGAILGVIESSSPETIGNLLFHDGYLAAQGMLSLAVYPQLDIRKAEIAKALEKNPNDPDALTERATLRMHWGELEQACEDLRRALAQPNISLEMRRLARQKFFNAFTIMLHRDFTRYEKYLGEYEQLIAIPPGPNETDAARTARELEERQRRAQYWHLVARGRESQGRFRDAFLAYLELAKLGSQEYVVLPQDGSTRVIPELYAEARLAALLRRPMPQDQRQELLAIVQQQWDHARTSRNREDLKRFVSLFGDVTEAGMEARLLLAEQCFQAGDLVEAEMVLLPLQSQDNPKWAAVGLERLAQLHTRLGKMQDAIFYYRKLAERYPDVQLPNGKTGRQIFDELAADKRFLPYLDSSSRTWLPTRSQLSEPRVESGTFPQIYQLMLVANQDDLPPSRCLTLAIVFNSHPQRLRILGQRSGADDFSEIQSLPLELPFVGVNFNMFNMPGPATQHLRCACVGPLAFFAWGTHLYALDLERKVFVWKRNLLGDMAIWPNGMQPNIFYDPNSGWTINYPDGTRERINHQFLASASFVAFLTRDRGLVVVEPTTGRVKWERPIPFSMDRAWLFGDERTIFVVSNPPGGETTNESKALAFSPLSGELLSIPDFLPAWSRSERVVGRCLLLREEIEKQREDWRLYDPLTAKNVWTRRIRNVTSRPQTQIPNTLAFCALAPKEGNDADAGQLLPHLFVFDVRTGRDLLRAPLPESARISSEATVLADDYHIYLAFNKNNRAIGGVVVGPNGRQIVSYGGVQMRTVLVEGPLLAFDRHTGQLRWQTELPMQLLILERFEESPLVLCASWQQIFMDNQGPGRRIINQTVVHAVDKRNGRIVECETSIRGAFHALRLDRQRGVMELLGPNFRVFFELADSAPNGAPAPQPDPVRPGDQLPPGNPPGRPVLPIERPDKQKPIPVRPLPAQPVPPVQIQLAPLPIIQPAPIPLPAKPDGLQPSQPVPEEPKKDDVIKPRPAVPVQQKTNRAGAAIQEIQDQIRQQLRESSEIVDRDRAEKISKLLEQLRRLQPDNQN